MKISVMGAGAVGCYYGGMLARAGYDVLLIGRPRHAEAINRNGLLLETASFTERVRLAASVECSSVQDADAVLCCVKTSDSAQAASEMAPFLKPDAVVVSLQNGIENPDLLRAQLRQEVIPAAVYVATEMAGDRHVRHHGAGQLVIGQSPRSSEVADMFVSAGIPVEISGNIQGVLWTKLIINCAYNALSAITALPYGRLVQHAGVEQVLRDVVEECLAVAAKAGVTPVGDVWEGVQRIPRVMANQTSSTAQDLKRGRRSEIDHLNGCIVRKGEELGVPVRVNRTLHTLVKILESRSS
ncbi:MAG: 2-dehydropantoate 2-reductase [Propionivibrio sp.]